MLPLLRPQLKRQPVRQHYAELHEAPLVGKLMIIDAAHLAASWRCIRLVATAILISAPLATAQAQPPSERVRVLVTGWRNASHPALAFDIAELVRLRLARLAPTATDVVPWSEVRATLESGGHPDTLSLEGLRMLGRLLRAGFVIDVGAARTIDGLVWQPLLITALQDTQPRLLNPVAGNAPATVADSIASMIARELTLRRPKRP